MPGVGEFSNDLPKTGKSKDWLAYADKKEKEFRDYHSATNVMGQPRNPPPLQDDYSKLLSQHALDARKMGMDLLRQEKKQMPGYRKGGRVEKTGPAELHKGEAVVGKPSQRVTKRKKTRSKSRSSSR